MDMVDKGAKVGVKRCTVDMDMVDMDMDMVASKDKCLVGQMPVLAFVHRGICPPGICPSRHLSAPPPRISVGSGICPDQMWVQAFVLLAFVRK